MKQASEPKMMYCVIQFGSHQFASKVSHNVPPAMAAQLGDVQLVLPAAALELKNHPPSKAKGDRSEVAKLARTEVGGIGVGWLVLGGFRRCWYW